MVYEKWTTYLNKMVEMVGDVIVEKFTLCNFFALILVCSSYSLQTYTFFGLMYCKLKNSLRNFSQNLTKSLVL